MGVQIKLASHASIVERSSLDPRERHRNEPQDRHVYDPRQRAARDRVRFRWSHNCALTHQTHSRSRDASTKVFWSSNFSLTVTVTTRPPTRSHKCSLPAIFTADAPTSCYSMPIAFDQARDIIGRVANERASRFAQDEELRPLDSLVGRTVRHDVLAPISTPTFDVVAIDGYAVMASQTSHATNQQPIQLRCVGTMKAGDPPLQVDTIGDDGMVCCVEVFVGAPFPRERYTGRPVDALIPRGHAGFLGQDGSVRILQIVQGPLTMRHKRESNPWPALPTPAYATSRSYRHHWQRLSTGNAKPEKGV